MKERRTPEYVAKTPEVELGKNATHLTLNLVYHTTLVEAKNVRSLQSFAEINPEVSESPLFVL